MSIAKSPGEVSASWDAHAAATFPRVPQVGDVWRREDGAVAFITRLRPDWVDFELRAGVADPYFGRSYWHRFWTFDAEATAKAKADVAAIDAEISRAILGTLAGPPRAELPDNPSEALAAALTSIADGLAVNAAIDRLADFARAIGEYNWAPDPSQPTTTLRGESARSACPRCGGPAYVGLRDVECLRSGGCKTIDERIGTPRVGFVSMGNPYSPEVAFVAESGEPVAEGFAWGCDETYVYEQRALGRPIGVHPTRDGAIALWRAAAFAVERSR
jgi:hypothetical protein